MEKISEANGQARRKKGKNICPKDGGEHDWEFIRMHPYRGPWTIIGGPKHFKCRKCNAERIE